MKKCPFLLSFPEYQKDGRKIIFADCLKDDCELYINNLKACSLKISAINSRGWRNNDIPESKKEK
jgi:hypothetical protein